MVLIFIGYKLAHVTLFLRMYRAGTEEFVPFIVTTVISISTTLLTGIALGLCMKMFYVVRRNYQYPVMLTHYENQYTLHFTKDMNFIHKPELQQQLQKIPHGASVVIDATQARHIDADVYDAITEFAERASHRNIDITYHGFTNDLALYQQPSRDTTIQ